MGAKRRRNNSINNYNNVVEIKQFQKQQKQVNILPRNRNQETYVLKLLDHKKDIVFGMIQHWTKHCGLYDGNYSKKANLIKS